jgi:hypothetical protein
MPKPSDGQEHAALRSCLDQAHELAVLVTPTLKSPSVARMTRFTPPSMKCAAAVS